jgi:hypothetical protein
LAIDSSNYHAEWRGAPIYEAQSVPAIGSAVDLQAIVPQILQKHQHARRRSALSPRLEFGVHI